MDYQSAGVDLQDQNMFNAKLTAKMPWLGGYAGSYDIGDDYIVSATDGVGTKIKLYLNHKEYPGVSIKNLGHDLVSAVMNDIVCTGARPLFMNDYLSVHDLKSGDEYLELMDGIKEALLQCGPNVPLIGGETAILPGDHKKGEFNIAGFGVGVVSKREFVDGREIESGDMMVGLKSSGFHCNGYSLIRKIYNEFIKIHPINLGDQSDKSFEAVRKLGIKSLLNRNQILKNSYEYELFNPSIADFIINSYSQETDLIANVLKSLESEDSLRYIKTLCSNRKISISCLDKIQNELFNHFLIKSFKKYKWDFLILLIYLNVNNLELKEENRGSQRLKQLFEIHFIF